MTRRNSSQLRISRGFLAIAIATILLFALGALVAPAAQHDPSSTRPAGR